jgi:hypothetical protein
VFAAVSAHQDADDWAYWSFDDDWLIHEAFKHALRCPLAFFTLQLTVFADLAPQNHVAFAVEVFQTEKQ